MGEAFAFWTGAEGRGNMGDHRLDLDRIIADLRLRREAMEKNIEETAAGTPERQQLVIATEKLRERLRRQMNEDDEPEQQAASEPEAAQTLRLD